MQIGPHKLEGNVLLAPMAGITDKPFRKLCRQWGASLAVSEMVASKAELRSNRKTQLKSDFLGDEKPISVQIVGSDPATMADAARYNESLGADIIDINMGCPAKKVCRKAAGSALLRDERLVQQILEQTVAAVDIPVTLKIRTGWSPDERNGVTIAKIAQQAGIAALTVHGRTRACAYRGEAEYDTIREIKQNVSLPVIANGDITCANKARQVLDYTHADAIMIGRGAQGQPWIFQSIRNNLATTKATNRLRLSDINETILDHLEQIYLFYGERMGTRIARKHIGWYFDGFVGGFEAKKQLNRIESSRDQFAQVECFLNQSNIVHRHCTE